MKRLRLVNPFEIVPPRQPPRRPNRGSHLWAKARYPMLLGLIVLCLTSALGYRFYNVPQLNVDNVAPESIYAPADVSIIDAAATDAKVNLVRTQSLQILRLEQANTVAIRDRLQQHLDRGSEWRRLAGPFPFAPTDRLALSSQAYLRRATASEWQHIEQAIAPPHRAQDRSKSAAKATVAAKSTRSTTITAAALVESPATLAIAALKQYRQASSAQEFATLQQVIVEMRSRYATTLKTLSAEQPTAQSTLEPQALANLNLEKSNLEKSNLEKPGFESTFFEIAEADWQQTKTVTPMVAQRILAQGIPQGLPTALLRDAVNLHMQNVIPVATQPWVGQLLLATLEPNLVKDEEQTRLQQEQAVRDVKPEQITTRQGEVIVAAGQKISPAQFALLDHFRLSQRSLDWRGLAGFSALVSGAIALYWLIERIFQPKQRRRDRLLILLLTLTTPLLIALRVPATNLPAIGILVGSFYGSPMGLTVAGLLAALLPTGMGLSLNGLAPSAASGMLCGLLAGRLRTREELALLGTGAGLLQGSLYLILSVATGGVWYRLLGEAAIQGLLGLAWSIVAIGSSPYLEQVFDLVTTVRLVELANPNRPLLKRLAAEAPGTFQHTLLVATLAEAAARALGCNVELVRTGTLYHDIGKMHDPQGFIENQMSGPNKHDLIDDPWKSADIIKKHVSEGVVMARRARLPKAVQAFIPEHQGTMLVAYFYYQAQQRSPAPSDPDHPALVVREEDFRYAGPDPQSRETGIVMVADACEAALRSLKGATAEEALAMINKILRARWQEQQLAASGLTRADMDVIAKVFVQTWQQFNHQRIVYPKLSSSPSGISNA
jgi:cyclic-di-AMP phosphodiesterase PgpH